MSASEGSGQAPYFFLSYAHMPEGVYGGRGDPNKWVFRFFDDLCRDLVEMAGLQNFAEAGFIDRGLRLGDRWPNEVSKALATCRVFVPLFCPRYFDSEHCGKEWTAIQMRLMAHAADPPPVIIPVVWFPVEDDRLPKCVSTIQYSQDGLWPSSHVTGMFGLAKFPHLATYKKAIIEIARRITEVAATSPLLESPGQPNYTLLANSFADYRVRRRIKVTVVAPDRGHLPHDRNPYYYGTTPQKWNPYRSDSNQLPIVSHITHLASRQGFSAVVSDSDSLDEVPEALDMVLADPWATMRPDTHGTLCKVGDKGTRWFPVIVPWNLSDTQTSEAEPELRRLLRQSVTSMRDITSLDDLRDNMPKLLATASKRYMKTAPAFPPSGPVMKRPRLMEPGDDKRPG